MTPPRIGLTSKCRMVNYWMRKPKRRQPRRAQPRSKTPPISFREETSGERVILMIDESFATKFGEVWRTRSRLPIFLQLGPGLAIVLGSRRVAKRRFAELRIG